MKKIKIKKKFSGSKSGNKTNENIQSSFNSNDSNTSEKTSKTVENTIRIAGHGAKQKIAIYARVSTPNQEKEDTVKSQIKAIENYLAEQKIKVLPENIYADVGFSGSTLARPSLDKLRDAIVAYEFEKVFIHDPDRLARSYVHQVILIVYVK